MKLFKAHGRILIFIGTMHSLFGFTPWAFGDVFLKFRHSFFFNVNKGLSDFPLLGGEVQSVDFAAFWFVYFGLALIPLGFLLKEVIAQSGHVPRTFAIVYLIVVLIGVYMIPFSGMTIIMLPHALLMLRDSKRQ